MENKILIKRGVRQRGVSVSYLTSKEVFKEVDCDHKGIKIGGRCSNYF